MSNPYASGNMNANPFDDNAGGMGGQASYGGASFGGMSQDQLRLKYEELIRKEEEIEAQESYLDAKEAELPPERKPNWPRCCPFLYHDINGDIPEKTNRLFCWFAYVTWYITIVGLVINFFGCATMLLTLTTITTAPQDLGFSIVYLIFYPPLMQVIWYRPLYNGARKDRASLYLCFLVTHALHCMLVFLILVGIPRSGSAGIINALSMYQNTYNYRPDNCDQSTSESMSEDEKKAKEEAEQECNSANQQNAIHFIPLLLASAMCTVVIVSWTLNLVLSIYLWIKIYIYFYRQRMTWRARQEIGALVLTQTGTVVSEAAKSPEVRAAAIQAAGEGMKIGTQAAVQGAAMQAQAQYGNY